MNPFFNPRCGFYGMVLVLLLITGCATTSSSSVQPEPEESEITAPAEKQAKPEALVEASEKSRKESQESVPLCDASEFQAQKQQLDELQAQKQQFDEMLKFRKLVDDLARYANLNAGDKQREQTSLKNGASTAGQNGANGNRVRTAFLLSLSGTGADNREALAMLDAVIKSERTTPLRFLASVLRVQLQEKQREMQKVEQLRKLESKGADRFYPNERIPDGKAAPPREAPPPTPSKPSAGGQ